MCWRLASVQVFIRAGHNFSRYDLTEFTPIGYYCEVTAKIMNPIVFEDGPMSQVFRFSSLEKK